jgi:hypothetical protein
MAAAKRFDFKNRNFVGFSQGKGGKTVFRLRRPNLPHNFGAVNPISVSKVIGCSSRKDAAPSDNPALWTSALKILFSRLLQTGNDDAIRKNKA